MNQIIYQKSLDQFIYSCLVSKSISDEVKTGMLNAGYPYVMPNWETSWHNSLPEVANALQT